MYCKYCGKQIAEDSTFCQYCGGKVLNVQEIKEELEKEELQQIQEIIETTKEAPEKVIQVEIKKENTTSKIANEIIGNITMIGLAIIGWSVFMLGFYIYRQEDIKPLLHVYDFGNSCYDKHISNLFFNWKSEAESEMREINRKIDEYIETESGIPVNPFIVYTSSERKTIDNLRSAFASELRSEEIRKEREIAQKVNYHREMYFKKDVKEKAKYSAIISLIFFIVGRYIIKFNEREWIVQTKTE